MRTFSADGWAFLCYLRSHSKNVRTWIDIILYSTKGFKSIAFVFTEEKGVQISVGKWNKRKEETIEHSTVIMESLVCVIVNADTTTPHIGTRRPRTQLFWSQFGAAVCERPSKTAPTPRDSCAWSWTCRLMLITCHDDYDDDDDDDDYIHKNTSSN